VRRGAESAQEPGVRELARELVRELVDDLMVRELVVHDLVEGA
jgi:hypothetical protein